MDSGTLKGSWKVNPGLIHPKRLLKKRGGTIEVFEYHYLGTTTLINKPWLSMVFESGVDIVD